MSNTAESSQEPDTLQKLDREILKDLREFAEAISENGNTPLIPWDHAKKDLEIE